MGTPPEGHTPAACRSRRLRRHPAARCSPTAHGHGTPRDPPGASRDIRRGRLGVTRGFAHASRGAPGLCGAALRRTATAHRTTRQAQVVAPDGGMWLRHGMGWGDTREARRLTDGAVGRVFLPTPLGLDCRTGRVIGAGHRAPRVTAWGRDDRVRTVRAGRRSRGQVRRDALPSRSPQSHTHRVAQCSSMAHGYGTPRDPPGASHDIRRGRPGVTAACDTQICAWHTDAGGHVAEAWRTWCPIRSTRDR